MPTTTVKTECDDCHKQEKLSDLVSVRNGSLVCADCFGQHYKKCARCGHYWRENDGQHYDAHFYCANCADEILITCDYCEDVIWHKDAVSTGSSLVCSQCFDEHYFNCDRCSETRHVDDLYTFQENNYCQRCYEETTSVCDQCGETVWHDDIRETDDGYFCRSCYRRQNKCQMPSQTFAQTNGIKRNFGVEIECYRHCEDSSAHSEGFTITDDGSISCPEDHETEEHRSKVLQGDRGIDLLKIHCDRLRDNGYGVNRSCGLHCHVDASDLTPLQLLNITSFMRVFDNVIFSLMPLSRRSNSYCKKLGLNVLAVKDVAINPDVKFHKTFEGIDRYRGFNLQAIWKHGTVEFRYHNGTVNFEKIKHWVILCLHIVEYANKHTWKTIKNPVIGNKRNLERFLSLVGIPEETKVYFRGRFSRYFRGVA